jgi:hypothetical protein
MGVCLIISANSTKRPERSIEKGQSQLRAVGEIGIYYNRCNAARQARGAASGIALVQMP